MAKQVHKVLGYDEDARTFDCANCGTVPLAYKHGSPKCSIAVREQRGIRRDRIRQGYVYLNVDGHWVYEHRAVMEKILGRNLLPSETVHHKNGVRRDNRPENLELWVRYQPPGQRSEDLLAWAYEVIKRYG